MDIDITDGERLFIETKELGEIFIKETSEGLLISSANSSVMILPQGDNGFILLNKVRVQNFKGKK